MFLFDLQPREIDVCRREVIVESHGFFERLALVVRISFTRINHTQVGVGLYVRRIELQRLVALTSMSYVPALRLPRVTSEERPVVCQTTFWVSFAYGFTTA